MSRFVVVVFPNEAKAHQGAHLLRDFHAKGRNTLHGWAIAAKDSDGKVSVKESAYEWPRGTAVGALIGGLAGLPGGLLAATIGAAGGALFGASADLVHRGAGREFVEKVSRELLPGKAAIVAEVSNGKVSDLNTEMGAIGGVVLRE